MNLFYFFCMNPPQHLKPSSVHALAPSSAQLHALVTFTSKPQSGQTRTSPFFSSWHDVISLPINF